MTQPDRRKGRGRVVAPSPVKSFAHNNGLPVTQPERLTPDVIQQVVELAPDLVVVVAYGLILPRTLLKAPQFGCVNLHASLLPRWRGAAPVARAIEAGDPVTGVTIMQMDEGLDTGAVFSQCKCPIEQEDTTETVHTKLSLMGADELIRTLSQIESGAIFPKRQNDLEATYAAKLNPKEAQINWNLSAIQITRKIQAYNPWPVSHSWIRGKRIRIWQAHTDEDMTLTGVPGQVVVRDKQTLGVMSGGGVVYVTLLQKDGKKRMYTKDFLAGSPIEMGSIFTSK